MESSFFRIFFFGFWMFVLFKYTVWVSFFLDSSFLFTTAVMDFVFPDFWACRTVASRC